MSTISVPGGVISSVASLVENDVSLNNRVSALISEIERMSSEIKEANSQQLAATEEITSSTFVVNSSIQDIAHNASLLMELSAEVNDVITKLKEVSNNNETNN